MVTVFVMRDIENRSKRHPQLLYFLYLKKNPYNNTNMRVTNGIFWKDSYCSVWFIPHFL